MITLSAYSPYVRLRKKVNTWGGGLRRLSEDRLCDVHARLIDQPTAFRLEPAPFLGLDIDHHLVELGTIWIIKSVFYSTRRQTPKDDLSEVVAAILHEVGHVFADPEPFDRDEDEWFGWEYAMSREIGLNEADWRRHNHDYNTGVVDFGDLSADEQDEYLHDRLRKAESLGLLLDGKAVSVR